MANPQKPKPDEVLTELEALSQDERDRLVVWVDAVKALEVEAEEAWSKAQKPGAMTVPDIGRPSDWELVTNSSGELVKVERPR